MSGNVFPTPTLQWGALLQDPATAMQIATREYVDAKVGGISEAPTDGQTYGRDGQTASWNPITLAPLASSTAPLMDGTASAGVATVWSRGDHVHPTDTSRYATSNPSGYVNAAGAASAAPVQSVATRTGAIVLTHTDITDWAASLAPYALLASPTFTGTPTLPTGTIGVTQTFGTSNTTLATTAFVQGAVAVPASVAPLMDGTAAVGTSLLYARQDHIHPTDTSRAPLGSPALTGTPTAPTATPGTNTTQIATTAFVEAAIPTIQPATVAPLMDGAAAVGTSLLYARQDHVHPSDTSRAPLASPALTGAPTSTTPATADNSTAIATTAFVKAQGYGAPPSPATVAPLMNGTAAVGTSLLYARQDHVHPTDTSLAPLGSPALTGTPTAPTATAGTSTTQLATTAFVQAALPTVPTAATATPLMNGTAAVGTSLLYARQDHVHPSDTSLLPLTGALPMTGALTVPDISLNDPTSPLISFAANGVGAPTVTTRSVGTKVVIYPALSGTTTDYAMGYTSSIYWFSVPSASYFFQWYAGTTSIATMTGAGVLNVNNSYQVAGHQVVGAQITGYGTPTGNSKLASFPAATATLAQTAAQLAQLIIDLKTHGLLGA